MTTHTSPRLVVGVGLAALSLVGLTACGSSSKSPNAAPSASPSTPSLGVMQRAEEAKVCFNATKALESAAPVLAKITSKQVTPAQALTSLAPVAAKIDALAKANAALPVGPALTALATDIGAAQHANLNDPAAVKAEVKKLTADATAVVTHCMK